MYDTYKYTVSEYLHYKYTVSEYLLVEDCVYVWVDCTYPRTYRHPKILEYVLGYLKYNKIENIIR